MRSKHRHRTKSVSNRRAFLLRKICCWSARDMFTFLICCCVLVIIVSYSHNRRYYEANYTYRELPRLVRVSSIFPKFTKNGTTELGTIQLSPPFEELKTVLILERRIIFCTKFCESFEVPIFGSKYGRFKFEYPNIAKVVIFSTF